MQQDNRTLIRRRRVTALSRRRPERSKGALVVVQERVLAEVMHELGNHLHKLYYWAEYLGGGAGEGTDVGAAEMLQRSVKGLDEFLRVALQYLSPIKLDFVSISVKDLVSHVISGFNGHSLAVRGPEGWERVRVLVDPARIAQAFQIALAQAGAVPAALTLRALPPRGESHRGRQLEIDFDMGTASAPGAGTGVAWALAEKFIDLHGGEMGYRPNGDGRQSLVIALPLYS